MTTPNFSVLISVLLAAAAFNTTYAATTDPLNPSSYKGQPSATVVASHGSELGAWISQNPLDPAYGSAAKGTFVGAAVSTPNIPVDSQNPLYPGYQVATPASPATPSLPGYWSELIIHI
jgi:hypothetical protein